MEQNQEKPAENTQQVQTKKRPDEVGGVNVSAMLKIFDPSNRKVFVEHQG